MYCNRSCLWVCVCLWVCLWVCVWVCLWDCYHDNSKLRASIFTKLGLQVKVVTNSSRLNVGRPAPPGRGLRQGEIFWLRLTTASAHCLRLSECFFIVIVRSSSSSRIDYNGWSLPQSIISCNMGLYSTPTGKSYLAELPNYIKHTEFHNDGH